MCRSRYFDEQCQQAISDGRVKTFTYLSAGQEPIAAAVATVFRDTKVNVFCQHRNHSAYLSFGGDATKLRDELLGLRTGTTGGIGGDPCHHFKNDKVWMIGHCGLVADQVPIAVGFAFATREPVVCFGGDATPEEDPFWPALGWAVTKKLPVLFVIENNNLSVLTTIRERRSWGAWEVAAAHRMPAAKLTNDDPWHIIEYLRTLREQLPAYLEVDTTRMYRHVGAGTDEPLAQDRLKVVKTTLLNKSEEIRRETWRIEAAALKEMADLWS